MKKIMILGASVYQVPLIQAAKRMGLTTIVASIPGEYPGFALADKVYEINTVDQEAILQAAREEQIDGICTTGTDVAVATIGYVCDRMGLCGISREAAEKATDKARMKQAFAQQNVSAARFEKVFSLQQAQKAAETIGYPVVVKRVDSSGSRGISAVWEPQQLKEAYQLAKKGSRREYVLVEEKLSGTEIGVDGVVQDGKLVFLAPHDKFVYQSEKTMIPVGHGFPYHGSEKLHDEIALQMQKAVTALGLDHCSVNADVFVKEDRAWIIEMGGRTGATCIPELISMYYGFDFYEKILKHALGEKTDYPADGSKTPCMARLLMSPVNGTLTGIKEKKLEAFKEKGIIIHLDYHKGHAVEQMINGTTRIGHVIAPVETEKEFEEILTRIYECIEVNGTPLKEQWTLS